MVRTIIFLCGSIGLLAACFSGCATSEPAHKTSIQSESELRTLMGNQFNFMQDCTLKDLDAAIDKNNNNLNTAIVGNICIQYINGFVYGFKEGSLIAQNYITAYIAGHVGIGEGNDINSKLVANTFNKAVISSTIITPYKLCIPDGTTNAEIAMVVIQYFDAHPGYRELQDSERSIIDALWVKYKNPDMSCKLPMEK